MKHLFFFLLLQYYLYANIKINNLYDCTYPSRAVCSAAYDLNNHRVHTCKTTVKNLKKEENHRQTNTFENKKHAIETFYEHSSLEYN